MKGGEGVGKVMKVISILQYFPCQKKLFINEGALLLKKEIRNEANGSKKIVKYIKFEFTISVNFDIII